VVAVKVKKTAARALKQVDAIAMMLEEKLGKEITRLLK
jgi:hypothetical protein